MELPSRKPTRLTDFDYSTPGAYFITICTENKQHILSRIVGGDIPSFPVLYQHLSDFATKNTAVIFGSGISTIILSAISGIMMKYGNI